MYMAVKKKKGKSRSDGIKHSYKAAGNDQAVWQEMFPGLPLCEKATGFIEECKYGNKKDFVPSLLPSKSFPP